MGSPKARICLRGHIRSCRAIRASATADVNPKSINSNASVFLRLWVRSKVFRSCKVLGDAVYQARTLSTLWAGRPMRWLWQRLEWLDTNQAGLLDICTPTVSPFHLTQVKLIRMLTKDPALSDLSTLWYHLAGRDDHRLLGMAKLNALQICGSAYAQHQWKFVEPLSDVVYTLIRVSALDVSAKAPAVKKLFDTPPCCLDDKLGLKLRQLFDTEAAMLADASLWRALHLFGRVALLTNMHIERLLATVRSSIPTKIPVIERVCCNGYLSQCLAQHLAAGGSDPRVETVELMHEFGVELERDATTRKKNRGRIRMVRGWMLYANAHYVGGKNRDERNAAMAQLHRIAG